MFWIKSFWYILILFLPKLNTALIVGGWIALVRQHSRDCCGAGEGGVRVHLLQQLHS